MISQGDSYDVFIRFAVLSGLKSTDEVAGRPTSITFKLVSILSFFEEIKTQSWSD